SLPGYVLGLAAGRSFGILRPAVQASPMQHAGVVALLWWLALLVIAGTQLRRVMAAAQPPRRRNDRLMLLAMSVCGGLLFAMVHHSIYGRA
ncbi:hypothetical protein ABTL47_19370, partial [Acinetobacter baumannii]